VLESSPFDQEEPHFEASSIDIDPEDK